MRKTIRSLPALLMAFIFFCGMLSGCHGPGTAPAETESGTQAQGSGAETSVSSAPAEPGLVRLAISSPVNHADVHKSTEDYLLPLNIYERLFDIKVHEDGSTSLVNGLAEDWSVSEDGRTYRFTLRDDAYFSDGTPVTASDVEFTFTRMLALQDSRQKDFANMILGAGAVMAGEADVPEGIKVLDDRNLEITLSEPFAGYIYQLATPSCSILSRKCVTEAGDSFGCSPEFMTGSGPYRVTEFTKSRIILERNPYYHCQEGEELTVSRAEIRVLASALIDRMFREGSLDLLDANHVNPEVVKAVYGTPEWEDQRVVCRRMAVRYLMLNVETPPLNDVRIRRAVQMAIDRQRILNELYNGEGMLLDGIYPLGLTGFTEKNQGWLRYDPEEAARLVNEVPGAGNVRLELAADSQSDTRDLRLLEMIRQDLSKAGLDVEIVNYDENSRMYLRRKGKLMAYAGQWSADYNDPDNFIYTFFGSRQKTLDRSSNYSDESVIGRIAAARTMQDERERLAEYAALEMILIQDEALWVPLFSADHLFVMGERLESFTPFWAGWSDLCLKDIVLKAEAR